MQAELRLADNSHAEQQHSEVAWTASVPALTALVDALEASEDDLGALGDALPAELRRKIDVNGPLSGVVQVAGLQEAAAAAADEGQVAVNALPNAAVDEGQVAVSALPHAVVAEAQVGVAVLLLAACCCLGLGQG